MSKKMQEEIDLEVVRLSPPKETAIGVMTYAEMVQLIRKSVNCGAIIGWAHAESMTRKRLEKKIELMEQEMTIIKEQMKSLELDLLVAENK